jgi:hypothetical protein
VCNELEKTSILLTKDGQSLVTIGPKGVHHLPENHYMNSSEYRISVRHSTADHLNDVFAIRDFSDWRLKIESQRHANGVLEWKEASKFVMKNHLILYVLQAIWQDRAFRNVLFGDLSRGDYDLSIEMENGQIWFYIYHHNRLFADTKLFGITGFHNSIDP